MKWARARRRTVGVAALTQGQRDRIREIRTRTGQGRAVGCAAGPDNKFFSKEEPFFIRTAGAVQGEERATMVSHGVAPNAEGKISQRPRAVAPRRPAVANVLLSRARLRTVVYCSILPGETTLKP